MAALSGQKTVTTAGTAVQLGAIQVNGAIMVKALDTNTGVVVIGNDGAGDVTVSNGLRLLAGDPAVFIFVGNLGSIWVDSAVNGEGVAWIVLDV
jgi:proline racemase